MYAALSQKLYNFSATCVVSVCMMWHIFITASPCSKNRLLPGPSEHKKRWFVTVPSLKSYSSQRSLLKISLFIYSTKSSTYNLQIITLKTELITVITKNLPLSMQYLSFIAHALTKCSLKNYRVYSNKVVKLVLRQKIIVTEW